jgi:hypothetical protein
MPKILRAEENFGPVIIAGVYANAVVIETTNNPGQREVRWHWCVMTPDGMWQVGWALRDGVRLRPDRSGNLPSEKRIKHYRDVATALAAMYDGEHVETYRNPGFRPNRADVTTRKATTLQKITPMATRRAYGARVRSERKAAASRANLAPVNQPRIQAGDARAERYLHLREGGMTVREIAEREGVTVNAVECVLKRARRLDAARVADEATRTDELAERRAAKAAGEGHLNAAQKLAIHDMADDETLVTQPDGSIRIDSADGVLSRTVPGGQHTPMDYESTAVLVFLRSHDALDPTKYTRTDSEIRLTDHPGTRLRA